MQRSKFAPSFLRRSVSLAQRWRAALNVNKAMGGAV
jgi:hypothetical protein